MESGDDERDAMDEFDVLLDDVLRTVANPEMPERVRVKVQTRVVEMVGEPISQETWRRRGCGGFAGGVCRLQRRMNPKRDARSTATAVLVHVAAMALLVFWVRGDHCGSLAGRSRCW